MENIHVIISFPYIRCHLHVLNYVTLYLFIPNENRVFRYYNIILFTTLFHDKRYKTKMLASRFRLIYHIIHINKIKMKQYKCNTIIIIIQEFSFLFFFFFVSFYSISSNHEYLKPVTRYNRTTKLSLCMHILQPYYFLVFDSHGAHSAYSLRNTLQGI